MIRILEMLLKRRALVGTKYIIKAVRLKMRNLKKVLTSNQK